MMFALVFHRLLSSIDRVKHEDPFEILAQLHINGKEIRILQNLYWEQEVEIRIEGECSEFKPTSRGVRRICIMSPDFNIYSEMILSNINNHKEVVVNRHKIINLR